MLLSSYFLLSNPKINDFVTTYITLPSSHTKQLWTFIFLVWFYKIQATLVYSSIIYTLFASIFFKTDSFKRIKIKLFFRVAGIRRSTSHHFTYCINKARSYHYISNVIPLFACTKHFRTFFYITFNSSHNMQLSNNNINSFIFI